jgi:adenosylmethionine-8-amino-7-oxononanoate aminotransferase
VICAAALAAIKIMERESIPEQGLRIEKIYKEWIAKAQNEQLGIGNLRALGSILAFEVATMDRDKFIQLATSEGLLLRPLGKTVYFMPPVVITNDELREGLASLTRVLTNFKKA